MIVSRSSFLANAPLSFEKLAQKLGALLGKYAAADFQRMIQSRVFAALVERSHRPGLGVVTAVDQLGDSRVNDGAGAHRARFECYNQRTIEQTPVTQFLRRLSKGDDLGVSCGVVIGLTAIVTAADDSAG